MGASELVTATAAYRAGLQVLTLLKLLTGPIETGARRSLQRSWLNPGEGVGTTEYVFSGSGHRGEFP